MSGWNVFAGSTLNGATWPSRVSEIWANAAAAEPDVQAVGSIAERSYHITAERPCSAFAETLRLFAFLAAYIFHSADATTASSEIVGAGSWEAVSWDAHQLPVEWTGAGSAALLATGLHVRPIWPKDSASQASRAWSDLKKVLPADEDCWEWTRWYDDHFAGRPPNQSLDFARVAIPDDDWERGPKHVNGIIAKLNDTRPGADASRQPLRWREVMAQRRGSVTCRRRGPPPRSPQARVSPGALRRSPRPG